MQNEQCVYTTAWAATTDPEYGILRDLWAKSHREWQVTKEKIPSETRLKDMINCKLTHHSNEGGTIPRVSLSLMQGARRLTPP